ncbi:MAG: hypothetical protein CMJ22_02810 [Phycisphaerae bacterium]|nr:hypothetical protein [Phycisphaerae bacterium]
MRSTLNLLTMLTLGILVLGGWRVYAEAREEDRMIAAARIAKERLHSEIRLRSALDGNAVSTQGWVREVPIEWFNPVPMNPWFESPERQWLEIAAPGDERRLDPREIAVSRPDQAAWWFNPGNGEIRARVPQLATSAATQALYDLVNH